MAAHFKFIGQKKCWYEKIITKKSSVMRRFSKNVMKNLFLPRNFPRELWANER